MRTNSTAGDAHTFYGLPGLFGAPLPATPNVTLRLAVADPPNACTKVSDAALGNTRHGGLGTALLAVRGNCSFADKARKAQAAGAALLVVYDSQPGADCDLAERMLTFLSIMIEELPARAACLCLQQHHGWQPATW